MLLERLLLGALLVRLVLLLLLLRGEKACCVLRDLLASLRSLRLHLPHSLLILLLVDEEEL